MLELEWWTESFIYLLVFFTMIEDCGEIFAKPHQLPPSNAGLDHTIPLKEGIVAFNLRPYMYFFYSAHIVLLLSLQCWLGKMMALGACMWVSRDWIKPELRINFLYAIIEDLLDELGVHLFFSI